MKDCTFCRNAHTDAGLFPDTDLSYMAIGEADDGYCAYLRTGDCNYTALLVEHHNHLVWAFHPRYCPNCGRYLFENADRYKAQ